jgi:hypothetical protein
MRSQGGSSVPRCLAGATYSVDIDDAKLVGDAAVFLEPPAACHRYPAISLSVAVRLFVAIPTVSPT